ncbi:MAG: RRQRL motif-containing zinc-binding protein [Pseudonocardia sp.]
MAPRAHQRTAQRQHRRAVWAELRYGLEVEPVGWCDHAWWEQGLPTFRWTTAPAGFVTRRQLRELDLAPGGHDPVAAIRRAPGRRLVAYLYRLDLAVQRRRPTPAQLAAVSKALAARRVCPTCKLDQGFCLPRSLGECWPCWERREATQQTWTPTTPDVTVPAPRVAPDTTKAGATGGPRLAVQGEPTAQVEDSIRRATRTLAAIAQRQTTTHHAAGSQADDRQLAHWPAAHQAAESTTTYQVISRRLSTTSRVRHPPPWRGWPARWKRCGGASTCSWSCQVRSISSRNWPPG